jgi:hypothetical protein
MTHNRIAESHADSIEPTEEGLTFTVDHLKIRTIDPPVLVDGELLLLSEIDPDYAARRNAYLVSRQGNMKLKVQKP